MEDAFAKIFMFVILPVAAISLYFAFKAGATKTILGIIAGVVLAAFLMFADQASIEALGEQAGRLVNFVVRSIADLFSGGAGGTGTGVQP